MSKKQRPNFKRFFPDKTSLADIHNVITTNKDLFNYAQALDRHIDDLEKQNEELLEQVEELFYQGTGADENGKIDHLCISAYESAQSLLIKFGVITQNDCLRT